MSPVLVLCVSCLRIALTTTFGLPFSPTGLLTPSPPCIGVLAGGFLLRTAGAEDLPEFDEDFEELACNCLGVVGLELGVDLLLDALLCPEDVLLIVDTFCSDINGFVREGEIVKDLKQIPAKYCENFHLEEPLGDEIVVDWVAVLREIGWELEVLNGTAVLALSFRLPKFKISRVTSVGERGGITLPKCVPFDGIPCDKFRCSLCDSSWRYVCLIKN
jgi:hypothetical protein